ncbi:MAG: 7-cyano-7-deazaguanine synthase QueC [Wenzhouxiangella sp.]|nr:7-cyano-7-deazaguanine synthase QueC [Wenzhouxiangella sp.]
MNGSLKAIVLLSGGLDSSTTLAIAKENGYIPYALSFSYGQRHNAEIMAARRISKRAEVVEHKIAHIDLRLFGGSSLTADIPVPKSRVLSDIGAGVPVTYVPARNTIFLSFALAWAEVVGARDIFLGVNALDYSGYPDCRPEFIQAFQRVADVATKAGVEGSRFLIHTPLIHMSKSDIIRTGVRLGVDYSATISCYDPDSDARSCGQCDACLLRLKGFQEAGLVDPALYVSGAGVPVA